MILRNNIAGAVLVIVCINMVVLWFLAGKKKHSIAANTFFYRLACISVFVWALFSALLIWVPDPEMALLVALPRYVGVAFMPVAISLHIREQFSTEKLPRGKIAVYLLLPLTSSILALTTPLTGFFYKGQGRFPALPLRWVEFQYNWGFSFHFVVAYTAIIIAVLSLLRTFYMVPRKMRPSINLMIIAVLLMVAVNASMFLIFADSVLDYSVVGALFVMWLFYLAYQKTLSASIAITSRGYVFSHLSFMILILDYNRRILDYNNNAGKYFSRYNIAKYKGTYDELYEQWLHTEKARISPDDGNIVSIVKGGRESHHYIDTHELKREGTIIGYLVEISDITRQFRVQRYLENFAMYDQLTGLHNRNAYHEYLKVVIRQENMPLLLVMGDINNLKEVNDTKGHLVGDRLLQDVAGILRSSIPANANISRIGGDEFVIILPRSNEAEGHWLIKGIEGRCEEFTNPEYGQPYIALGCAVMNNVDENFEFVYMEADRKMYTKKRLMKQMQHAVQQKKSANNK